MNFLAVAKMVCKIGGGIFLVLSAVCGVLAVTRREEVMVEGGLVDKQMKIATWKPYAIISLIFACMCLLPLFLLP